MADNPLEKAEGFLKKQPWYVWAGAAIGAGLVGYYVIKRRAKPATTPAPASQATQGSALNGYQVDNMAGLPYGYDVSSGPTDNFPAPTSTSTVNSATQEQGIVRTRNSNPALSAYDQNHPEGVPIRQTPGGTEEMSVPYGSEVQLAGPPINGPNMGGSSLWYPLSNGGYIGAVDITSIITGGQNPLTGIGNGGPSSDWQNTLNPYRNTVDQHAISMDLLN